MGAKIICSLHTCSPMSKPQAAEEAVELNPDFTFDLSGDLYNDFLDHIDVQDLVKKGSKPVCKTSVCIIVAAHGLLGTHLGGRHHSAS